MNRNIIVYSLLLILVQILILSCNRPKEVLNRKNMEKLMYDVYIAEAMIENDYQRFDTPAKKEALINEVFRKHNITQAQWDTSLSWYSDKIDIYLKMNDSVKAKLKRDHQRIEKQIGLQYAQNESYINQFNSLSYIPISYSFDQEFPYNGFRFNLDSAQIISTITQPNFTFQFEVIGIPDSARINLESALMLQYKDTMIYQSINVFENTNYRLQGNRFITNDTLRNISGYIKLQDTTGYFKNTKIYNIQLKCPKTEAPIGLSNEADAENK